MATETMTVLFTDMVGSTAQRTRVGDAAADALLYEHNQIVRDVAGRFAGRVVKDTGDGAMLVFDGAADAVHAGVAIQEAIEQRNFRGGESIGLRVGVSLGDLVLDGEGLHGIAAHEAAWVCALADAGEVLVSDVVRVVAAPRLEARLEEHGTHELKGIAAPLVVWSVLWERLVRAAGARCGIAATTRSRGERVRRSCGRAQRAFGRVEADAIVGSRSRRAGERRTGYRQNVVDRRGCADGSRTERGHSVRPVR